MLQTTVIAQSQQDALSAQITALRGRADALKLRMSDLEVQRSQLAEQRSRIAADVAPTAINKQMADVEHELAATRIQFESTNEQIHDLQHTRDVSNVGITVQPPMPPEPMYGREQLEMTGVGLFVLLIPIVFAYSRRIWKRSGLAPSAMREDSERLQRMEQAIESIAVEVERIGESQRFTTKLLAERQPDALARSRREPGVITPH